MRRIITVLRKELQGIPLFKLGRGFSYRRIINQEDVDGVPYDKAVELSNKYGLILDSVCLVIEAADIEQIAIGNKIEYKQVSEFYNQIENAGEVVDKKGDVVMITKGKSRSRLHSIKVNDLFTEFKIIS